MKNLSIPGGTKMSEFAMNIEKEISGETLWMSNIDPNNTHVHKIKNLNSKHIANILHFFKITDQSTHGHSQLDVSIIIKVIHDEAMRRELSPEFLQGAPYYYNPNEPYEEYQPPSR